MTSLPPDRRVAAYLGRVLHSDDAPAGTCFQVAPGVLVTAWHVLDVVGAASADMRVRVDPLAGGPAFSATVSRLDPLHDLAVLVTQTPWPAVAGPVVETDQVPVGTPVTVTGHAQVADAHSYRFLNAPGKWAGGTTRDDAVALGCMTANRVLPGMSGAPVTRDRDGAVVGVVSSRYNTADGWLADNVWLARTEDLMPLVAGLAEVAVATVASSEPVDLLLEVTSGQVRLTGAGLDVSTAHGGVPPGLAASVAEARRSRARARQAKPGQVVPEAQPAEMTLSRAGQLLAMSFLPSPVARELGRVLQRAYHAHAPVRMGLSVPSELGGLPWEGLANPGDHAPLALHPLIEAYRRVEAGPVREIPGPLRIVVAIAAPDESADALDYERELRNVIAEVRSARQGAADVRVVPFASPAAIHAALEEGPAHVLHIYAHGQPGTLDLENEDGTLRRVSPDELVDQAIPPGKMPPVIALATRYEDAAAEGGPAFAARLCQRGAAVVITADTSVTDRYATRVFARVYGKLAQAGHPDAVATLAAARREVQREFAESGHERDAALAALDEWAVVTVLAASGSVPVFDPQVIAPVARPRPSSQIAGLGLRDTGYFVGRRAEQRSWPRDLLGAGFAGLVIYGVGGIGKTALAAEMSSRIMERDWVLVSLTGQLTGEGLLEAVVSALRRALVTRGMLSPEARRTIDAAAQDNLGWQDRLALLREQLLGQFPLLVVLDNFEDNLEPGGETHLVRDELLGSMLAGWLAAPGWSRLLFTSRFRFTLPGGAERSLSFRRVGSLSLAETRKLAWSLPALDLLDEPEFDRVWRLVGGHPRSLEYLDALLSGGSARYPDITDRLSRALIERLGGSGMREWLAAHSGLDAALAEAAAISASDVLLDELLSQLRQAPGAGELLLAVSVYRQPVDSSALLFQVGERDETAARASARADDRRWNVTMLGKKGAPDDESEDGDLWPDQLIDLMKTGFGGKRDKYVADLRRWAAPPFLPPADLPDLIGRCQASGLLTVTLAGSHPRYFVHRWTATQIAERAARDAGSDLADAHRKAAAYWQWRVKMWPQTRRAQVRGLLEALHHLREAGEIDQADDLAVGICDQLHMRGAWDEEFSLIQACVAQLPPDSGRHGTWAFFKGRFAERQGDRAEAERQYQRSLDICERTGDQLGEARARRSLGDLALEQRDYTGAGRQFRRSLEICEQLDDQAGLAAGYHYLGALAFEQGDYAEAERQCRRVLEVSKRIGDGPHTASGYGQLGVLAHIRGDDTEAERLHRRALQISKRLDDPVLMAAGYNRLAQLAASRGDEAEAERQYRGVLAMSERLHDLAGIDTASFMLGMAAYRRGDYDEAGRMGRRCLTISEQLDDQAHVAANCVLLGMIEEAGDDIGEAVRWHVRALTILKQLQNRQAETDELGILARYRAALGPNQFLTILTEATNDANQARSIIFEVKKQQKSAGGSGLQP